jgi:signal recognition particle receptor subunit beta
MAEVNAEKAEVSAKILYWGAAGAGKTANLEHVHRKLRPDNRGELRRVPTALDPSVCFESLPITLGELSGLKVHLHVVAVPGSPEHAPTRKQQLDRVDGIVLVLDASPERLEANLESFDELRRSLSAYGRSLDEVPLVVQYNKRDQADDFTLEELHRKLDLRGTAVFEAVATQGKGVLQALTTISKRVIRRLREEDLAAAPEADAEVAAPRAQYEAAALPEPLAESEPCVDPEPTDPPAVVEPALEAERAEPEAAVLADQAIEAAQSVFDAGLPAARAQAEAPPAGLEIAELGEAQRRDARSFAVPVTLRDAEGRSYAMTVTVRLDPPEPTEH